MLVLLAAVTTTTTTVTTTASGGDSGLSTVANAVGIFTGLVVLIGLITVFVQWLKWRDPVTVSFLLPKERYTLKTFPGAPKTEVTQDSLTIGTGSYDVMIQVRAMLDLDITQLRVLLDEGGDGERPRQLGVVPSRLSQTISPDHRDRHRYVDWNGEVRVSEDFEWPRFVHEGDSCLVTQRLRTHGDWKGNLVVIVATRGGRFARSRTYKLPLVVEAGTEANQFLASPTTYEAELNIASTYDRVAVVRFAVGNAQQDHIERCSMNFRVPDYVVGLAPSHANGDLLMNPRGTLDHGDEVLVDQDGLPHGSGIAYWNSTDLSLPGRIMTHFHFRVPLPANRNSFPVRVTLTSPDLDDPIEMWETLYPNFSG
jgi:hypothetical protein